MEVGFPESRKKGVNREESLGVSICVRVFIVAILRPLFVEREDPGLAGKKGALVCHPETVSGDNGGNTPGSGCERTRRPFGRFADERLRLGSTPVSGPPTGSS